MRDFNKKTNRENQFRGNVVVEIIQYPELFGSISVPEVEATNCSKLKKKKEGRMGKGYQWVGKKRG